MHEVECNMLAQRPIATLSRLMARIVTKVRSCPNEEEGVCGRQRKWDHLMDRE